MISTIALIVSLAAGYFSLRAVSEASNVKVSALVDERLAARELKFVQSYAPRFREMFGTINGSEYGADWNPKSLEELVAPIVEITSGAPIEPK